MRVFIATANYGTLFIDLSTGDGVQRLAAVIEQRTGICPNYQRLLFNKQQLHPHEALGKQGLVDGCTIQLLFPLRGGMLNSSQLSDTTSLEELFAEGAPEQLLDPISECLFRDPVISAASGRTYSRVTLEQYQMKDPFTRQQLKPEQVIANRDKQRELEDYMDKKLKEMIGQLKPSLLDTDTAVRIHTLIRVTLERSDITPCLNAQRQIIDILHGSSLSELQQFIVGCQPPQKALLIKLTQRRADPTLAALLNISPSPAELVATAHLSCAQTSQSPIKEVSRHSGKSAVKSLGLWVGLLDFSVTDADLKSHFSAFEDSIVSVNVIRERGKSKFGFVNFSSSTDREKACRELQGSKLKGRAIKLSIKEKSTSKKTLAEPPPPSSSEFEVTSEEASPLAATTVSDKSLTFGVKMSNIHSQTRDTELLQLSSAYGRPLSVNFIAKEGYGYVNYATLGEAQAAAEGLNGCDLHGRMIRAKLQERKDGKQSDTRPAGLPALRASTLPHMAPKCTAEVSTSPSKSDSTGGHSPTKTYGVKVTNLSSMTTKEHLVTLACPHGRVASIFVKTGYAYINFLDEEDAGNAASALDGLQFAGSAIRAQVQGSQSRKVLAPIGPSLSSPALIGPSMSSLTQLNTYPSAVASHMNMYPAVQSLAHGSVMPVPHQTFSHSPMAVPLTGPFASNPQFVALSDDAFKFAKKRFEAEFCRYELLGVRVDHSSQQQRAEVKGPPEHVIKVLEVLQNVKEDTVSLNSQEWSYLMTSGTGSNLFRELYVPWAANPDVDISPQNHTCGIKFTGCPQTVMAAQQHLLSFRNNSMSSVNVKKENLGCSKEASVYLEKILERQPRQASIDAKREIELQHGVKITFQKRLMIEGRPENVQAAQQAVKSCPALLGGFTQKSLTKLGSKVMESLVVDQVLEPLKQKLPYLVVKTFTMQEDSRPRRDSGKDRIEGEKQARTESGSGKRRDSSKEREKRKPSSKFLVKIHLCGAGGDVETAVETLEAYRPSFYCWRLPRSWSSCLSNAVKDGILDLHAIARDSQTRFDFISDQGFLHIAADSREATEDFKQEIQTYLDDNVRWTETKSLTPSEARFLRELRWEQIEAARQPQQALEISPPRDAGEGRKEIVLRGVKAAVDATAKQIDECLEGLKEDVVRLCYPSPLKWAVQARLKDVCQEAKETLDTVAYYRKNPETKEIVKSDVYLLGVDQDSMESVKRKFGELFVPVSLKMELPDKKTGNIRAKLIEIAKEHSVGVDIAQHSVTVHALSDDDLGMAKESILALVEDRTTVSGYFSCSDPLVMKLLCSKMKCEIVRLAKEENVFVNPSKDNSRISLRGSKAHTEGLKQKLHGLATQVKGTLVEHSITVDSLHAAALYVPAIVAKINSLQSDSHVTVTWPRRSKQTVLVREVKVQSADGTIRAIQLCRGSIVDEVVDAVVNAANEDLVHAGGVARALCNAGGNEVQVESSNYVASHGRLHTGQAVPLSGGDLKCSRLIHTVAPRCHGGRCTDVEREQMKATITNCLIECEKIGARSVAVPALGTGIFQFPVAECAKIMLDEITTYLTSRSASSINIVRVVLIDQHIVHEFERALSSHESSHQPQTIAAAVSVLPPLGKSFQWKFCTDAGMYQAYDETAINEIERQYTLDPNAKFSLNTNGFVYDIDLSARTQSNKQTGKRRVLRRDVAASVHQHGQWYFRDDSGLFCAYDPQSNSQLESAHASGSRRITLQINQFGYEIDMGKNQQNNLSTGKIRLIKRDQPKCQSPTSLADPTSRNPADVDHDDSDSAQQSQSVIMKIRGQNADVQSAKGKVVSIVNSSYTKRSVSVPFNLTKVLEKQLNRLASEHGVKLSFTAPVAVGASGNVEFEGIRVNVGKAVNATQMKIIELQSQRGTDVDWPSEWESQSEEIEVKPVGAGSPEWTRVLTSMKTTIPNVTLIKLDRIQNQWLWEQYVNHKERMARKNSGAVNEKELYHGTRSADPAFIYKGEEGFDMRFSAQGLWGTGCYFAVNASYSKGYSYRLPDGSLQMFIAKVLTGDSVDIPSNSSLRMPPKKSDASSMFGENRYDTVTGVTGGSRVYVTFKNDKAYPFYLITYKA